MHVISTVIITILAILVLILFTKSTKIKADRYLIAFFITIILGVLNDVFAEVLPEYSSLFRFGSATVPAASAFLFLYTNSLISSKGTSILKHILLFIPALVIISTNVFVSEIEVINSAKLHWQIPYYVIKMGSSIIIIILASHKLNQYSKEIKSCFSDIEKIDFQWLRMLLNASIALFVFIFLGFLTMKIYRIDSIESIVIFINLSVFVFILFLAIYGIKNTNTFKDVIASENLSENEILCNHKVTQTKSDDLQIDEGLIDHITNILNEHKPYKSERLTITQLSQQVGVPQRQLSTIINSYYKCNFFDFINSLRIKEFNNRIECGDNENFTILAIAFDCGFSSKSAFNRAYKKHVGVPPSQFVKSGTIS